MCYPSVKQIMKRHNLFSFNNVKFTLNFHIHKIFTQWNVYTLITIYRQYHEIMVLHFYYSSLYIKLDNYYNWANKNFPENPSGTNRWRRTSECPFRSQNSRGDLYWQTYSRTINHQRAVGPANTRSIPAHLSEGLHPCKPSTEAVGYATRDPTQY